MNYMEAKLLRECLKRDEGGSLVAHLVERVPCIKAELLLPWLEFDSSFAACHPLSLSSLPFLSPAVTIIINKA